MPQAFTHACLPEIEMTNLRVSMQALMSILLLPLVISSVFAEESRRGASADADSAAHFQLKGILVSSSGRSILVNNSVAREGDRVAGVDILSIKAGEVRIAMGSQEQTVRVGFSTALEYRPSSARISKSYPDGRYGPVMRGETLSEIAERQVSGDITMNQMMVALFQANPQAFGGNINVLREGATLLIPDAVARNYPAPRTAAAEVARQMDAWRTDYEQPIQLANKVDPTKTVDPMSYGPVARGETLSDIAVRISRNGATMNEMMTALFHANPQAFSGNIDILHEGAVLRIPDEGALRFQETATAELVQRTDAWQHDSEQQLQSASVNEFMHAPHDLGPEPGGLLLSMQNHE